MKNRNKKGFTIMELVIVIAIVAVLAAVLIPTFAGLIKKANNSAYEQERTNQLINDAVEKIDNTNWLSFEDFEKALAEGLAKAGNNSDNIEAAVKDALEEYTAKNIGSNSGLTESQIRTIIERSLSGQLTKTQVESIIRSALNNLESGITQEQIKKIVADAVKDLGNTSISLEDVQAAITAAIDASGSENAQALKDAVTAALAGFTPINEDALKTLIDTAIASVESDKIVVTEDKIVNETYTVAADDADKTIYIVTDIYKAKLDVNGSTADTKIIIDAPNINELTVNGPAQVMRIFRTAGSSTHVKDNVEILNINSGRVVIEDGAKVGQLTAAPAMRAVVTVDITEGTEVTKLYAEYQYYEGTNDYIVINNEGTVDNAYMTASPAVSSESTTNVVINNVGSAEGTKADKLTVSYKGSNLSTKLVVDGTTYTTNGDQLGLFAGGSGTAEDPFLIVDYDTMQAISNYYNDDVQRYFKVKDGITEIDCNEHKNGWKPVNIYGYFDGNGVVFKNLDTYLFDSAWESKIENFTVKNARVIAGSGAIVLAECHRSTLKDIVVDGGYVEGSSRSAVFVAFGDATEGNVIELINCHSNATVVSCTDTSAAFVGHPYSNNGEFKTTVIIDKCYFNGKISNTGNSTPYFVAQSDNTVNVYLRNMDGLESYYAVNGVSGMSKFSAENTFTDENDETYYRQTNYTVKYTGTHDTILSKTINCSQEKGQPVSISGADVSSLASTAKLEFMVSPNAASTESGSYTSTYIRENVEVNNGSITASSIFNCDIMINGEITETTGYANNNSSFNVVNNYYGKTHNGALVKVTQYDSSNNVVGIVNITIAKSNAVAVRYNGVKIKSAGAGNSYVYDCGEDLTGKTVTIKIYDRKTSTWTYTYEETEVVKTLVQGTDFTVSGSTITINNVEDIKLRNKDLYNYFKEYCQYVITID